MDYTERKEGFQIRDVMYFGLPPKNEPIKFDIVKWSYWKGHGEYCYSVGFLTWNEHEGRFDFESVGLRWLEAKPSDAVIDMIMNFAKEKTKEIQGEFFSEDDWD